MTGTKVINSVAKEAELVPVVAEASTDVEVALSLELPTLGSLPTSCTEIYLSVAFSDNWMTAWLRDSSDQRGGNLRLGGAGR